MAANDSTLLAASEISVTNITEAITSISAILFNHWDLIVLEFRVAFTSLACIYIGSYGSLRRPPSAKSPKPKKEGVKQEDDEDDPIIHGLLPSDVIMFPILAGTVLVGLYYLIKWIEDPDIINKILRVYFSVMSVVSLGKLFGDGLDVVSSFIFPTVWRAMDGRTYHIDSGKKGQWYVAENSTSKVWNEQKKTPLPGWLSELDLPPTMNTTLWGIRHLLLEQWTVRLSLHGIVNEKFKIKFNGIFGVVLAVISNTIYYATESIFLSNIMGYAFSYAGIMFMSPTTFGIGSAFLFGLFFYDIYMVFYTPYMVTVATKLDVPIKIVFEGPTRSSMLGLGDIVIPGIFIGLCLRFDHFLHYHGQQKLVPVELKSDDGSSGQLVTNKEMRHVVVKPEYVNPSGQWGNRFWSTKLINILSPNATPELEATVFTKTYFHASMIGYLLAIVTTLIVLTIFKHAQPALLYLVPGVVISVWVTGAVKGDLREMWMFTEDGSLDKTDVVVEVDGHGKIIREIEDKKDDEKVEPKGEVTSAANTAEEEKSSAEAISEKKSLENVADKTAKKTQPESYPVILFSIEAPVPDHVQWE